jgi:hypothetical protein
LRAEFATERRTHEEAHAALHEAQAVIAERAERSVAQEEEIIATLAERAAHVEELRTLIRTRDRPDGAQG